MIIADYTEKQTEIMQIVLAAADKGEFISIVKLWKSLSYGHKVSKQAVLCTLRSLRGYGMIEHVYGDDHTEFVRGLTGYVKPTLKGYQTFRVSA